jgi:hypothetical protein
MSTSAATKGADMTATMPSRVHSVTVEGIIATIERVVADDIDFVTVEAISMHAHCSEAEAEGAIHEYRRRAKGDTHAMSAPAGPYIVVHRVSDEQHEWHAAALFQLRAAPPAIYSRSACATLESARGAVALEAVGTMLTRAGVILAIGEDGGRVGLLPDGSEIVVEATTYGTLAQEANFTTADPLAENEVAILAAWNAEYGIGIGEQA